MAVLTLTEIQALMLDALQSNVSVDQPLLTTEQNRYINDAYNMLWEESGGGIVSALGTTVWGDTHGSATATATTLITSINEILHIWASLLSNSTGNPGEQELRKVESSEIIWRRAVQSGLGTYGTPKIYSLTRLAAASDANVNKFQIDVWPAVAGYYFPTQYVPQFIPLDGVTFSVPDVNDTESRDIAYIAAMSAAPQVGRAEFVPNIAAKISKRTQQIMERKLSAAAEGKQNR